ncbi:MAG: hypothetical protein RIT27_725 [Pseudomonadota bacterium]|jgi:hypothetical protein
MAKSIEDVCTDVLNDANNALGCAVVDLESGLLLGVAHKVHYFTQSYLDAVAAAAVDMMRGNKIRAVENMIGEMRGEVEQNLIQEVQMTTKNTYHFMTVVPNKPNALVVLITNRKANLGMGWAAVRKSLADFAPLCP